MDGRSDTGQAAIEWAEHAKSAEQTAASPELLSSQEGGTSASLLCNYNDDDGA